MANRVQEAFDSIKAQPQLIESTKQVVSKKYRKKTRPSHSLALQKALATVCMAFVLAAGIFGYSWLQAPVSYVSIDVNPSIELALNRFDRVVSMTAYNMEGEEILKSLSLKGKKYTEAIDLIVESKVMDAYLTDESEIVFTVAADGSRKSELKSGVESCSGHIGHDSHSISADIGMVSKAHDHGLSLGKYYACLQLAQYDDTVTVDGCRDMSMSQIHGLIHAHEQDGEHGQDGEHEHDTEHEHDEEHGQDGEYGQDVEHEVLDESGVDDGAAASHSHHNGHHQGGEHE